MKIISNLVIGQNIVVQANNHYKCVHNMYQVQVFHVDEDTTDGIDHNELSILFAVQRLHRIERIYHDHNFRYEK